MALTLLFRYWYVAVIAALVAAIGVQQMRISHAHNQLSDYKLEVAEDARINSELARQEGERRQKAFDNEAAAARVEKEALEADVVRLAGVADGVRDELSAAVARSRNNACTANGSKTDYIGVFAELLTRLDARAGVYAQEADRARLAGSTCEKAYDSISRNVQQ